MSWGMGYQVKKSKEMPTLQGRGSGQWAPRNVQQAPRAAVARKALIIPRHIAPKGDTSNPRIECTIRKGEPDDMRGMDVQQRRAVDSFEMRPLKEVWEALVHWWLRNGCVWKLWFAKH